MGTMGAGIAEAPARTGLADVDFVIEAVPEQLHLKSRIFSELDAIVRDDVVLASNTSSLSITELAVHTKRPGKVVGMHFFNPAPVLKLVEVVRTVVTEPEVVSGVTALAEKLGKTPVVIGDRAGFIANGLLFGYLNHAARMYEQRYATREDLDAAMRYGCGYPMGPLALLDLIGLDTAYEILDALYRQSRDRLHAPVPVLKQMITAVLLGRKSGRGFYASAGQDSSKGGPGAVTRSLGKAVNRGKLSESDRDAALQRISTTTSLDDFSHVDLVVEAVAEELEVKRGIFATLDEVCKPGAILATTTSSLPVIECAAVTSRPGDVVGLHFFNPAPVMKLVEVVQTISTSGDVAATARQFARSLGKVPVT